MIIKTIKKRLDSEGRLVIPIEFLKYLELYPTVDLEIMMVYGEICIKKFDWDEVNLKSRPFIGVIRSMDRQHRVFVPKNYQRLLGITPEDELEITLYENEIRISKRLP